jgi:hypothetical protein
MKLVIALLVNGPDSILPCVWNIHGNIELGLITSSVMTGFDKGINVQASLEAVVIK